MTHQKDLITLTPAAISQIDSLLIEENNPNLILRIYIIGGGCSGFQYGYAFEEKINEDDEIIEIPSQKSKAYTIKVMIDSLSRHYLEGATLDYVMNLQGARFIIHNPHAKTTCGCGSSFSIE
ncbi:MAG: yadR [Francisellaceae bacterium]|nr:yadR [Francisellaceae bacterium]